MFQGWSKTNAFHVCITSYKLVIQDQAAFRRKKWKYLVSQTPARINPLCEVQRAVLVMSRSTPEGARIGLALTLTQNTHRQTPPQALFRANAPFRRIQIKTKASFRINPG